MSSDCEFVSKAFTHDLQTIYSILVIESLLDAFSIEVELRNFAGDGAALSNLALRSALRSCGEESNAEFHVKAEAATKFHLITQSMPGQITNDHNGSPQITKSMIPQAPKPKFGSAMLCNH